MYFSLWDSYGVEWGRNALPLVHRPTICPLCHVPCNHPTTVHPKRNRHPEIHEVRSTNLQSAWLTAQCKCLREFIVSLCVSVLGTLAATYLCVAVTVKYYLMDSHAVITPDHSQRSVNLNACISLWLVPVVCNLTEQVFVSFSVSSWASMFSVVPTICFGFQVGLFFNIFTCSLSNVPFI